MQMEDTAKNITNDLNKWVQKKRKKAISLNSWKHSLPGYVFTNILIILLHYLFIYFY